MAMDDKHTCKDGEHGFPVAAVERGKQVIVTKNESLQVADHHFTKFSTSPSVTMEINVPEHIEGSFYEGQIHVGVKENCFQPSSPIRGVTELSKFLENGSMNRWGALTTRLHFCGCPDHRVTFLFVQMALTCLFLRHDKDIL